jgi:hypothetical protein
MTDALSRTIPSAKRETTDRSMCHVPGQKKSPRRQVDGVFFCGFCAGFSKHTFLCVFELPMKSNIPQIQEHGVPAHLTFPVYFFRHGLKSQTHPHLSTCFWGLKKRAHFRVFLDNGSSKTPQKYFLQKVPVEVPLCKRSALSLWGRRQSGIDAASHGWSSSEV